MRKLMSFLIIVVMIASLAPLGVAETRINPRLKVCVDYLNKNTDVRNTATKCESLQREEVDCVDYLESKGVDDAVDKCEILFRVGTDVIKDRQYVDKEITDVVDEWKLKRVDRLMVRRAEDEGMVKEFISGLSDDDAAKFFTLGRATQKRLLGMNHGEAYGWLDGRELVSVDIPTFQKREISDERVSEARSRINSANTDFRRARNSFVDNKAQFLDLKTRLENCDSDSSVCESLRSRILIKGDEYVFNSVEMKINYLTRIRERIATAPELEDDDVQDMVLAIDDDIDELMELRELLGDVENQDRLREIANNLRDVWTGSRARGYYYGMILYSNRADSIVDRALYLERRIDGALAELQEAGIDVSEIGLDDDVEMFSQEIEFARLKIEEANGKLRSVENLEGDYLRENSYDARLDLLEAKDHLKEGTRILGDVLSDIRDYGIELENPEEGLEDQIYEVIEIVEESEENEE